jgi:hypothetical protein
MTYSGNIYFNNGMIDYTNKLSISQILPNNQQPVILTKSGLVFIDGVLCALPEKILAIFYSGHGGYYGLGEYGILYGLNSMAYGRSSIVASNVYWYLNHNGGIKIGSINKSGYNYIQEPPNHVLVHSNHVVITDGLKLTSYDDDIAKKHYSQSPYDQGNIVQIIANATQLIRIID